MREILNRRGWMVGVAGLAIGMSATGGAQDQSATPSAEQSDTGSSGAGGLTDIVVTARRTAENSQLTPISISVATGADLVNRSIVQLSEIQQQTPSLQITYSVLSSTSLFVAMRGQVSTDFRTTIDSAVGLYVDGIYYPHAMGTTSGELWDIDRIEVLKGPQGTLYGRSTTGGAISTYTNTPKDEWQGLARLRYGSFDEMAAAAMINIPIAPTLTLRLTGETHGHEGYGVNAFNGRDLGQNEATSVRASLQWTPTPALTLLLRGDYAKVHDTPGAAKGGLIVPAGSPVDNGGFAAGTVAAEVAAELGLTGPTAIAQATAIYNSYAGGDPDDGNLDVQPFDIARIAGGSLTADLELSQSIALRSITGYRHFKRHGSMDLDGTPFQILAFPDQRARYSQFSQETQLLGNFGPGTKAILGVFYSTEKGYDLSETRAVQKLAGGSFTRNEGNSHNKSLGFYGQSSIAFADWVSATAGLRYSIDDRELTARNRNPTFCSTTGTSLATTPNCAATFKVTFKEISYTAGLEFQPMSDLMVYLKTSRGYRAGGIPAGGGSTLSPAAAAESFIPYKPEIIKDYEGGIKATLFDRRLRANLAVYHSDYANIQVSKSAPNPSGPGVIAIINNSAAAKVDGVEVELTAIPVSGLELTGTMAYTDGRYTEYLAPPSNLRGVQLRLAPKWTYSLSGAYTLPTSVGDFRAQMDYSHQGRAITALPAGYRVPFGILNGRLSLAIDSQKLNIALYGKNLTDKRYFPFLNDVRTALGFYYNGNYNAPRTYGIEVQKAF